MFQKSELIRGNLAIISGAVCGSSTLTVLRGAYCGDSEGLLTWGKLLGLTKEAIFTHGFWAAKSHPAITNPPNQTESAAPKRAI